MKTHITAGRGRQKMVHVHAVPKNERAPDAAAIKEQVQGASLKPSHLVSLPHKEPKYGQKSATFPGTILSRALEV